MNRLISISSKEDIPPEYQGTSIGLFLEYHNLKRALENCTTAQLLVGTCMDNRIRLRIPGNFAFVIRTGGANLRNIEFKVSFAIAVGGVNAIALIGHTNCGMVNLSAQKEILIKNLVENAGWEYQKAEEHFMQNAPVFETGNEVDFIIGEVKRLRLSYPDLQVVPMLYRVEDHLLYIIDESSTALS